MIKAILFDLDGTLVDSCEWHYHALNIALIACGKTPISEDDHIKNFNGYPTRVKLEKLGLTEEEKDRVNFLKQRYTSELIKNECLKDPELIKLIKELKSKYKIGCVTNCIRTTAELMLSKVGVLEFFDILVTNLDVNNPKPSPDGYNFAMIKLNVQPDETLIIEDCPKGIEAARQSGAHCGVIKNRHELSRNLLYSLIAEKNDGQQYLFGAD